MVFILEDDDSIRKLVTYALQKQGYEAAGFSAPSAFWEAIGQQLPELLLLDIMLPEEDGISVLKRLRTDPRTAALPVILLTAKSAEYDRVEGLDAGADDYVTKPFGMMELLARVRALLRRTSAQALAVSVWNGDARQAAGRPAAPARDGEARQTAGGLAGQARGGDTRQAAGGPAAPVRDGEARQAAGEPAVSDTDGGGRQMFRTMSMPEIDRLRSEELHFGELRIFPARYEVYVGGAEIALTHKEYQLLLLLAENEGIVMTREVLLDRIWDLGMEPENRTLDVHIRKLRAKLGETGACIETVRGVGYRFRAAY